MTNFEYEYDSSVGCIQSQQHQAWSQLGTTEPQSGAGAFDNNILPPSVIISQYSQGPYVRFVYNFVLYYFLIVFSNFSKILYSIRDLESLVCHTCSTPFDLSCLPLVYDLTPTSISSPEVPLQPSYVQVSPDNTTSTYRSATW